MSSRVDKSSLFGILEAAPAVLDSQILPELPSALAVIKGLGESQAAPPLSLEQREVQNRSGGLWECIGRKSDPDSGGYSYDFRIRPELNDLPPLKEKERSR